MRSYFDILNELMEAIESDICMTPGDKTEIVETTNSLFDLLWKYSD